jgi:hypothetical protein
MLEERIMWHLWRFCPRPLLQPWKWSWRYYAWRMETYSGIPMHEVTWRTFIAFLRQPKQRRAVRRYARWVGRMHRIRRV